MEFGYFGLFPQKIIDSCIELKKEIDPYTSMAGNGRNPEITTIKKELYEKIMAGTEINRELLDKLYPGLGYGQLTNMMQSLKAMKGIDSRLDGRLLVLFARHEA